MSFRIRLARSRPMRLLGSVAMKCWAFSGVYILICFLLYWLYGGILAFFLLCFATTGLYLCCYRKLYLLTKSFIIILLLIYRSIFINQKIILRLSIFIFITFLYYYRNTLPQGRSTSLSSRTAISFQSICASSFNI